MYYLLFNRERGLGLLFKTKKCDTKQNTIDKKADKPNNKNQQKKKCKNRGI